MSNQATRKTRKAPAVRGTKRTTKVKATRARKATAKTGTMRRTTGTRSSRPAGSGYGSIIFVAVILGAAVVLGPTIKTKVEEVLSERKQKRDEILKNSGTTYIHKTEIFNPKTGETRVVISKSSDNKNNHALPKDVQAKLDLADKQYSEGHFGVASNLYGEIVTMPIPPKSREIIKNSYKLCKTFDNDMRKVAPEPEADPADLYDIILTNGRSIRAKVTNKDEGKISIVKNNNFSGTLPEAVVDSMEPVDAEELKSNLRLELQKISGEYDDDGLSRYSLGIEALKKNFPDKARQLFLEASRKDKNLAQSIREQKARKIFEELSWLSRSGSTKRAKRLYDQLMSEYPDTKAAQVAKEAIDNRETIAMAFFSEKKTPKPVRKFITYKVQEKQKILDDLVKGSTAKVETKPVTVVEVKSKSKDPNILNGDKLYTESMDLVRSASNANSNKKANKLYKKAEKELMKTLKKYEQALKSSSGNREEIEEKIQEVNTQLYWCRKLQKFK